MVRSESDQLAPETTRSDWRSCGAISVFVELGLPTSQAAGFTAYRDAGAARRRYGRKAHGRGAPAGCPGR